MEQCVLVQLLKYSTKVIPNDSGITDLLDHLLAIEDQPVLFHTTQIILIYTGISPVSIHVFIIQKHPVATLHLLSKVLHIT